MKDTQSGVVTGVDTRHPPLVSGSLIGAPSYANTPQKKKNKNKNGEKNDIRKREINEKKIHYHNVSRQKTCSAGVQSMRSRPGLL